MTHTNNMHGGKYTLSRVRCRFHWSTAAEGCTCGPRHRGWWPRLTASQNWQANAWQERFELQTECNMPVGSMTQGAQSGAVAMTHDMNSRGLGSLPPPPSGTPPPSPILRPRPTP